jgi:hypothetical protein
MASSGRLIRDTAEALSVPQQTVSYIFKALIADEMVTTTGARGVSAPEMTAEDAVTLLIGIAAHVSTSQFAYATRGLKKMQLRAIASANLLGEAYGKSLEGALSIRPLIAQMYSMAADH